MRNKQKSTTRKQWILFIFGLDNYDDVLGGASKASDKCSFAKISVNNKDWCNGRSELLPYEKWVG